MAEVIQIDFRKAMAEQRLKETLEKVGGIREQYRGDIRSFMYFCIDMGYKEGGYAFSVYLSELMNVKKARKSTWERHVVSIRRYLTLQGHELTEKEQRKIADLRKAFGEEKYKNQAAFQEGQTAAEKDEILSMIDALEDTRERAICLVNLITTNRPSEMTTLQIKDFNLQNREVNVYLKKQKEWKKKRLTQAAVNAVRAYIREYELKQDDFFVGRVNKGGKYTSAQISEVGYNQLTKRLLGVTPYTLRKTQVVAMHEDGADLATIAKQTGHNCLQTLAKHYLNVSDKTVDNFL